MKLSIQLADHEQNESIEYEDATEEQIFEIFSKIDWESETEKANEIKKVSPTITIEDNSGDKLIWFSSVGDKNKIVFYSECGLPGEVSAWFGFSKKMGTVALHTENFSKSDVVEAIRLFLLSDEVGLKELY